MTSEKRGWIRVDGDRCGFCEQRHALDIVYHCVGCDQEVCALCAVLVREHRDHWCPVCAPEEE